MANLHQEKTRCCVYLISINRQPVYVGSTINYRLRVTAHFGMLNKYTNNQSELKKAFQYAALDGKAILIEPILWLNSEKEMIAKEMELITIYAKYFSLYNHFGCPEISQKPLTARVSSFHTKESIARIKDAKQASLAFCNR